MFNFDIEDRGIFYPESKRTLINPARHESIQEIFDTITHETIHQALEDQELDETQEHWAIRKIMWQDEYFF
jgi:hypothetical protein